MLVTTYLIKAFKFIYMRAVDRFYGEEKAYLIKILAFLEI